jgi:predicted Rossmann fold flavoprotein
MKKHHVYAAIIGGGAAGLMCAIRAAQNHPGQTIVILEKADRVGKKLLVTGNGRCNLSHMGADAKSYHGDESDTLINILFEKYSPVAVLSCFRTLGLLTHTDSEQSVYPLSNQASSVLDVLRMRIAQLPIETICNTDIRRIQKTAEGYEITTPELRLFAKKLVIAAGGKADYAGRDNDSRELLRTLGLSMTKLTPSLSPVKVKNELLKSLKGIRASAKATLIRDKKIIKIERGEVQFADGALSGICIFNLSRHANLGGCEIHLNLLPDFTDEQVERELTERFRRSNSAGEIFTGMFHKNIGLALLKSCGIKPSASCQDISNKEIKSLFRHITDWRFVCEETRDFKKAQVTAGGVRLSEIDPRTFESNRHRGLYLIGEVLDIDGDCGGYNLQFAFASGMCAGDHL